MSASVVSTPAATAPSRAWTRTWLAASLGLLALLVWLQLAPPGRALAQWLSDVVQLALALTATALPFHRAARTSGRTCAFWALIGTSNLLWSFAQALWTFNLEAVTRTAVMAPSDVLFVLCTAPLMVALVIRPDRPIRTAPSLAFDIALLVALGLHGYLYFSAGYLGFGGQAELYREYRQWVHDIGNVDSAVVMTAVLYLLRGAAGPWRRTYYQIGAALLLLNSGSALSSHMVHVGSYAPGLLDLPWSMPFLWLALAAAEWRPIPSGRAEAEPPAWADTRLGTWIAVLALVLVPGAHLGLRLLAGEENARVAAARDAITFWTTGLIGALFLFRQLWVLRRVERSEGARRERVRLLFQVNPLPMWVADAESHRFLDVNEAALALYGWERTAFLELRTDEVETAPTRHRRADGRTLDVQVATHELELGGRSALLAVVVDVSERLVAERERERLRAMADRSALEWERTFDAIDAAVLMLDADLVVTRLNRAAHSLAPASAGLLGQPLGQLGRSQPWACAHDLAQTLHAGGHAPTATCRDAASGHSFEVWVHPLWTAEGERQVVVARDITRLVELQESLRHQELTAAMGSLIAGVAHEVRNPLFGISASLDAFEASVGEDDELKRFAQRLRSQLNRLTRLMQELLEYGRPLTTDLVPRELSGVVLEAVQQCQALASERGAAIETRIDPELGRVAMNRQRLFQVFRNLIENALQHTEGPISVDVSRSDAVVECRIADGGRGFDPADLSRVFEPFFTRRRGGTGIGLSIVQRVVEEHGGNVAASNQPGGGGLVTVRLPVAAGSAGSPSQRSADSP